jgi:hypothetical protein
MKPTKNGIITKAEKAAHAINDPSYSGGDNNIIQHFLCYPNNPCELRSFKPIETRAHRKAVECYVAYEDGECWKVLVSENLSRALYDGNEFEEQCLYHSDKYAIAFK